MLSREEILFMLSFIKYFRSEMVARERIKFLRQRHSVSCNCFGSWYDSAGDTRGKMKDSKINYIKFIIAPP